jgi:hypothetical protein
MYGLPNGGSSNGRTADTLSPHEKALQIGVPFAPINAGFRRGFATPQRGDVMSGRETMQECESSVLERCARIFGPESASARALAEYRRRMSAGEDVRVFTAAGMWLVGPPLPAPVIS